MGYGLRIIDVGGEYTLARDGLCTTNPPGLTIPFIFTAPLFFLIKSLAAASVRSGAASVPAAVSDPLGAT
jgi:hypothetical protein